MAALVLAVVGLFAAIAPASAAPVAAATTTAYPPVINVTVNVNITIIINGGVVIFSGGGFLGGEPIVINVNYGGPSGLRSNRALADVALEAAAGQTTRADASGHFSAGVQLTQLGVATLTATGQTSGRTASLVVTVTQTGNPTDTAGTTTVAGSTVTTEEGAANAPANGDNGAGLASTGASIAGPLTIGASALIAGLALLFFGTRLAIRRKRGTTAQH